MSEADTRTRPLFNMYESKVDLVAVGNLVKMPWFSRKLDLQEVVKSSSTLVLLSDDSRPWDEVADILTYCAIVGLQPLFHVGQTSRDTLGVHSRNVIAIVELRNPFRKGRLGLLGLAMTFPGLDPKDHIIARF